MSAHYSSATFVAAMAGLCEGQNAAAYISKFTPLDATFVPPLKNYEALAFHVFATGDEWSEQINHELWTGSPSSEVVVTTAVLDGALEKLPRYRVNRGLIYRGYQTSDVASFVAHYKVDSTVLFPGFTSASLKEDGAYGGNVLFIIRSASARAVWFLGTDFCDGEVLLPSDRRFRVVAVETQGARAVIVLEELA